MKPSSSLSNSARRIIRTNQSINAIIPDSISISPIPSQGTGPLSQLSVAVKSNICVKGHATSCSSNMLRDFRPSYDATVVGILKERGAHISGMTNCDEFGMGSMNTNSIYGPVVNPVRVEEKRSAGGSSGGSAAAVAAGMVDVALGTDTGGSVRLPASYCGIVGFKPSYGMISRWGVVSFADSLDCVGILSNDVTTVSQVFAHVSRHDKRDPTSASPESRRLASSKIEPKLHQIRSRRDLSGIRIGIPQEYFPRELSPIVSDNVRSIIGAAQELGATLVPVSLPSTSYALSAYYVLASAEASSNLARYDGVRFGFHKDPPAEAPRPRSIAEAYSYSRTQGFGPEVKKRILLGTYALTSDAFDNYFLQAQRVRQLIKNDFNRVFSAQNFYNPKHPTPSPPVNQQESQIDLLIHPSAIRTAPPLDQNDPTSSPIDEYVQDVLTVPASLAGLSAVNIPCPRNLKAEEDGWPIGASIVGQWGTDELVLATAEKLLSSTFRSSSY